MELLELMGEMGVAMPGPAEAVEGREQGGVREGHGGCGGKVHRSTQRPASKIYAKNRSHHCGRWVYLRRRVLFDSVRYYFDLERLDSTWFFVDSVRFNLVSILIRFCSVRI